MAFAITNKGFPIPVALGVPAAHKELADQTAAVTTDTGVAGLRWIRVRAVIKSGLANTNTAILIVRVGTGAALTSPEVVAVSPTMTFVTGDTNLSVDLYGFSNATAGFQSFAVAITNSGGAGTYDLLVDCG